MSRSLVTFYWCDGLTLLMSHCMHNLYHALTVMMKKAAAHVTQMSCILSSVTSQGSITARVFTRKYWGSSTWHNHGRNNT